jgi:hypothetical protein
MKGCNALMAAGPAYRSAPTLLQASEPANPRSRSSRMAFPGVRQNREHSRLTLDLILHELKEPRRVGKCVL